MVARRQSTSGIRVGPRLVFAYAFLIVALAIVVTLCFRAGGGERPAASVTGTYALSEGSRCLGGRGQPLEVKQSGQFIDLETSQGSRAQLRLQGSTLSGEARCRNGTSATARLNVRSPGSRQPSLDGTVAGERVIAAWVGAAELATGTSRASKRSAEETFGRLMLAIAVVILAARLVGALMTRIGQPQVMGEVLAGILLGPTLLGAVAPAVKDYLFPSDIVPLLSAAADIGLAFFMFLVGLELNPAALRGRMPAAALISNVSAAFPIMLGVALAVPLYVLVGPDRGFVPFALFIGVSMSITAFPVLARIVLERRMLKRPVGAIALAAAAIDDVTAWSLLALASAIAVAGSSLQIIRVVGLAILFSTLMALVGRRLLARVSDAYDEAGTVPAGWIAAIFVGVLLSSYASQQIGIAAIFGAFVMGLIMPRRTDLTDDVNRRVQDFVVTVLLPLFFVVTGLKTNVGQLNRPELWVLTLAIFAVAVLGKWVGAAVAARFSGFGLREAAAIGALMNTRGLTELIVLNIGLELGVITPALFTMLVIMALATTFMAGPLLRLIDRTGELSTPVEEDLRQAERVGPGGMPERAILVASLEEKNLDGLLTLAEPLARHQPPREIIVARLIEASQLPTGLTRDDRNLSHATADLDRRRRDLMTREVAVRVVAFNSSDPGRDLVKLASAEEIDLVLVDGRRPLLGEAVPGGSVGPILTKAPSDVAVLVARDGSRPEIGPGRPVVVPFGGTEHDWGALELGAWLAKVWGAPLRLLGAAGTASDSQRDASRLLANASLIVQQFAGVVAEPVLIDPGRKGVLEGAQQAGLLIVGLSDRWRQEGLGPVRSEIASLASAPTLFVRRGRRPGALTPAGTATRFAWSGDLQMSDRHDGESGSARGGDQTNSTNV
jgi:Kef-type K+ transport system membrane component KefB